jgi:flagellar biosynthesis/type III secretory pathway protein FliH
MTLIPSEADMAEAALRVFDATEASRMQAAARAQGFEAGHDVGFDAGYIEGRRDGVLAERKRCVFLLCEAGFHEAAAELGMQ